MTATEIATFAAGLFALANPLIRLGPYLQMTDPLTQPQRRQFLFTGLLVMTVGYVAAVWFGRELLELLGVSVPSLNAAGGTVIIAIAFPMVLGGTQRAEEEEEEAVTSSSDATWRTQAVVPFGVPLMVGGGTLAYLITATTEFPDTDAAIAMSITSLFYVVLMGISLHFAHPLSRRLGPSGSLVIGRLFGFVLLAIGFSILTTGLKELLPGLA